MVGFEIWVVSGSVRSTSQGLLTETVSAPVTNWIASFYETFVSPCREKRRRITLIDYLYIGRQDSTCTLGDVANIGLTVLTWVMDILFEYINLSYLQLWKTSFEWDIAYVQLGLRKSFKMCVLTCTCTTDINTNKIYKNYYMYSFI